MLAILSCKYSFFSKQKNEVCEHENFIIRFAILEIHKNSNFRTGGWDARKFVRFEIFNIRIRIRNFLKPIRKMLENFVSKFQKFVTTRRTLRDKRYIAARKTLSEFPCISIYNTYNSLENFSVNYPRQQQKTKTNLYARGRNREQSFARDSTGGWEEHDSILYTILSRIELRG